jgi:PAS domain-containing protein
MKSDRIRDKTLEGTEDGFYTLDREWRFIYINHRAANNLSREPGELIGKVICMLFFLTLISFNVPQI